MQRSHPGKVSKVELSKDGSGFGYKKCPVCGVIFYIDTSVFWTYVRRKNNKRVYCCTHKCARAFDAKYEKKAGKKVGVI